MRAAGAQLLAACVAACVVLFAFRQLRGQSQSIAPDSRLQQLLKQNQRKAEGGVSSAGVVVGPGATGTRSGATAKTAAPGPSKHANGGSAHELVCAPA